MSTRCSVCDTMARQQQQQASHHRTRPALSRSHSHDYNQRDDFEYNRHHPQQAMHNEYERVASNARMARPFSRSLERNSMNSSRRSFDNDTTLADEESIKPMEYYRG